MLERQQLESGRCQEFETAVGSLCHQLTVST